MVKSRSSLWKHESPQVTLTPVRHFQLYTNSLSCARLKAGCRDVTASPADCTGMRMKARRFKHVSTPAPYPKSSHWNSLVIDDTILTVEKWERSMAWEKIWHFLRTLWQACFRMDYRTRGPQCPDTWDEWRQLHERQWNSDLHGAVASKPWWGWDIWVTLWDIWDRTRIHP